MKVCILSTLNLLERFGLNLKKQDTLNDHNLCKNRSHFISVIMCTLSNKQNDFNDDLITFEIVMLSQISIVSILSIITRFGRAM